MTNKLMHPTMALLSKIGSALIHAQEFQSPHGHPYDKEQFDLLMQEPDVLEWVEEMGPLLPVKRIR